MSRAREIAGDPQRLQALCELWREGERRVWLTMTTGSMVPAIPVGARFLLACGSREPAPGEIVAFRRGAVLAVHRLMEIRDPGDGGGRRYLCRGDANPQPDPPLAREEIVGVVVRVLPLSPADRLRCSFRRVMLRRPRLARLLRWSGARLAGGSGR